MALQDRQGEVAVVAVAVVEGERDEALAEIALDEAAMDLVERDDLDLGLAQARISTESRKSGVISRRSFGWKASARGGRT